MAVLLFSLRQGKTFDLALQVGKSGSTEVMVLAGSLQLPLDDVGRWKDAGRLGSVALAMDFLPCTIHRQAFGSPHQRCGLWLRRST